MELQKASLEKQVATLERRIARKPEGTLTYVTEESGYRYYVQTMEKGKRVRHYIKEEKVQEKLATKKLQRILLLDAKNELEATEAFLKKRKTYTTESVFNCDAVSTLVLRAYERWENADYERNPYHPDGLKVEGAKGVMVASKSEKDITYGLADALLPNHYEQKRVLSGHEVYPDFTIFHPLSGKIILWEHFGRMNDDTYAKNAYWKIDLYQKNGYFPQDNLILTFEDKEHPLTNRVIFSKIQYYFGDWLKAQGIDLFHEN